MSVCTHNIRVESVRDDEDNAIFLDEDISPFNHQFHPLFRPVKPEFIQVVEERIKADESNGQLAVNTVLKKWLDETSEDNKVGEGVTSFEKLSERLNFGSSSRLIICQKCHSEMNFDVTSQNICPNQSCKNNPTFYTSSESGPYRKYQFHESGPNTIRVKEQEPIALNPSGRTNLFSLHDELKKFWPPEAKSFAFYGDGLPSVSYERIKSDSIECVTHGVNIQIKDTKLLEKHCRDECELDWPLKGRVQHKTNLHRKVAWSYISGNVLFFTLSNLSLHHSNLSFYR